MSNCHFIGGWIEENDVCFNIDVLYNIIQTTFVSVDFELNGKIIYAENDGYSCSWMFNFSNCSILCNNDKRNTLLEHRSEEKYLYINVVMNHCQTDFQFRSLSGDAQRCYLGIVGYDYRNAIHSGTNWDKLAIIMPCYVGTGGLEYPVNGDKTTALDDGKTIIVDMEKPVHMRKITIESESVSSVDLWSFSSTVFSKLNKVPTKENGKSLLITDNCIKKFIVHSDVDISDAKIVVNMAEFSNII